MRIAGIDFGTVRIGIAVADTEIGIATPYKNYTRRSKNADTKFFQELAHQERIGLWVVGLPVHVSGDESKKSREARDFASWLATATDLPVNFFDERYTTKEAESMLMGAKMSRKKRKVRLDKLAAQILLTAYLESRDGGDAPLEGLEDYHHKSE